MKMTYKVRLVRDVVEILKKQPPTDKEGNVLPIDHNAVSKWVISRVNEHGHEGAKYGSIHQGDIAIYFREFHNKLNPVA